MKNPDDRKYTKEHEWVKVKDGVGTVGITNHAQELLTDVVFAELPAIGKKVVQMKPFAVVESVKSVSDVYAPVSGDVVEVNKSLESNPEKINQDAFGEGWIAKIKLSDLNELNNLMNAEEYTKYSEHKH